MRKITVLCTAVFLFIGLSGCANLCQQKDLEVQGLKNRLLLLTAQNQQKDEEINSLRESLVQKEQEGGAIKNKGAKKAAGEVKSRPNIRQVQIALQNAGYNPGIIDAKMGQQTRQAIKEFQKANGLVADGKTGKKTWDLLQTYLYKKEK